jgi:hypothetical protein
MTTELDAQRAVTAGYIASDPTEVVLIPSTRALNASGAPIDTPGAPRPSQTFRMILLNFDQRPLITLAGGVERAIDYHLLGTWDATVAVGDTWTADGKRYEVVGLSDGFDYETKAFVAVHVPRDQSP